MAKYQEKQMPHTDLLFNPNNPRFEDSPTFSYAQADRIHESSVQERAMRRLTQVEAIQPLKQSIVKNGWLAIEKLIVRPYASAPDRYVVVEGNRRLAAIRWIIEDHQAGIDVPIEVLQEFENLSVVVIGHSDEDELFLQSVLGVRHVSGIKEWGGYQRALVIVRLRDEYGLDGQDVAERLGLTTHEVNRRYRALKALQQMEQHEDFGSLAHADLYPLFHEAVSIPAIRRWLDWRDDSGEFAAEEELANFYDMITPNDPEDVGQRDPKLRTYSDVRELRVILENSEARLVLLDPHRSLLDAVSIAKREELSRSWVPQVAATISALQAIGVIDLQDLGQEELMEINRLKDICGRLIESYSKLMG